MERCGLKSLNFSNISDDELDRHLTEAAKDFPFCGEQMLKFLYKERGINGVLRKLISDLRPQTPRIKKNIYIANSSQFLSRNVLWSRNVQRQPNIYLLRLHRSNSENLTQFEIAANTLINDVCWRIFYRRNRETESL